MMKNCIVLTPTYYDFMRGKEYILELATRGIFNEYPMILIQPPTEWCKPRLVYQKKNITLSVLKTECRFDGIYVSKASKQERIKSSHPFLKKMKFNEKELLENMTDTKFWQSQRITSSQIKYGENVPQSLMTKSQGKWNLNSFDCSNLKKVIGNKVSGITSPWCYYGYPGSFFNLHTEDYQFLSISYLHHGASKIWYGFEEKDHNSIIQLLQRHFPSEFSTCPYWISHRQLLLDPSIVKRLLPDLTIYRAEHKAGMFLITGPGVLHQGFNSGYNLAEAVNFLLPQWISMMTSLRRCLCIQSCFHPNPMDLFFRYIAILKKKAQKKLQKCQRCNKSSFSKKEKHQSNICNHAFDHDNDSKKLLNQITITLQETKCCKTSFVSLSSEDIKLQALNKLYKRTPLKSTQQRITEEEIATLWKPESIPLDSNNDDNDDDDDEPKLQKKIKINDYDHQNKRNKILMEIIDDKREFNSVANEVNDKIDMETTRINLLSDNPAIKVNTWILWTKTRAKYWLILSPDPKTSSQISKLQQDISKNLGAENIVQFNKISFIQPNIYIKLELKKRIFLNALRKQLGSNITSQYLFLPLIYSSDGKSSYQREKHNHLKEKKLPLPWHLQDNQISIMKLSVSDSSTVESKKERKDRSNIFQELNETSKLDFHFLKSLFLHLDCPQMLSALTEEWNHFLKKTILMNFFNLEQTTSLLSQIFEEKDELESSKNFCSSSTVLNQNCPIFALAYHATVLNWEIVVVNSEGNVQLRISSDSETWTQISFKTSLDFVLSCFSFTQGIYLWDETQHLKEYYQFKDLSKLFPRKTIKECLEEFLNVYLSEENDTVNPNTFDFLTRIAGI